MSEWKDVHIIDIDLEASERIQPDRGKWRIYFMLSAPAPKIWADIFADGRKKPRHTRWPNAVAKGKHIILEAPPGEIELHKANLDQNVAYTNAAYRRRRDALSQAQAREGAEPADDRRLLQEIRQKLFGRAGRT